MSINVPVVPFKQLFHFLFLIIDFCVLKCSHQPHPTDMKLIFIGVWFEGNPQLIISVDNDKGEFSAKGSKGGASWISQVGKINAECQVGTTQIRSLLFLVSTLSIHHHDPHSQPKLRQMSRSYSTSDKSNTSFIITITTATTGEGMSTY